ncbi:hypothetical protein KCU88_g5088, partial [Aureobasidium melanogenum]
MQATSVPRVPELPNEVLQNIIDRLQLQALKNVRLTCKLFATMAEPRLFQLMVLVPYIDCLEGFASLMRNNPSIARHVKTIHYQADWRYHPAEAGFSDAATQALTKSLARNGLRGLHDEVMEVMLLSECLRTLPSLREAIIQEETTVNDRLGYPFWPPSYFVRLFGEKDHYELDRLHQRSYDDCIVASSKPFLMSCHAAGLKLPELYVTDLNARTFLEPWDKVGPLKELSMYRAVFAQLRVLRLFLQPRPARLLSSSSRRNLASLLTAASKLETLFLSLTDNQVSRLRNNSPEDSWLSCILRDGDGKITESAIWPHLKSLDLSCLLCQEAELVALARNHRHTLKHLELADITLVPSVGQVSPPCWVRTLKEIRPFKIDVAMCSYFSNGESQVWNVAATVVPIANSLKDSLMRWLRGIGSDECPIERCAVSVGHQISEKGPAKPDLFEGDSTLTVQVIDDEDSELNGSDDFSDEIYGTFNEWDDEDFDSDGYPYEDGYADEVLRMFDAIHSHL